MEIKEKDGRWIAKKNKKAKTWEDITDIISFDGDFASVMGKAGRTTFHSYLGKLKSRWVEMYGVTSLLNYWGEKDRLVQWAVDRAVDHVSCEWNPGKDYTEEEITEILVQAGKAHLRSLGEAGTHGTDKHALVETYIDYLIDGIPSAYVSQDEQINTFIEWSEGKTFIASELPLKSKRLWTAGTCDFICEIDGKRYIGDLKTSNYVSYKHFIQCGAYALMHEEMGKGKIDGILIVHIPRTGGFNVFLEEDVDNYKKDFESLVRMVRRDKDKSYELYSS